MLSTKTRLLGGIAVHHLAEEERGSLRIIAGLGSDGGAKLGGGVIKVRFFERSVKYAC